MRFPTFLAPGRCEGYVSSYPTRREQVSGADRHGTPGRCAGPRVNGLFDARRIDRYTAQNRDDVHHAPDGLSKADEANPQAAGVCEFVT